MKYIFVAGAPGSKWSSVAKNIYYSPSIDRSDHRDDWTYCDTANQQTEPMHVGAYWDPGMACALPEYLSVMTKKDAEQSFDYPFAQPRGNKFRIIKSHIFCFKENLEYLRSNWPESPIVLVHRSNDSCLGWWVRSGGFDISYPDYRPYYQNFREMARIIELQNAGVLHAWWANPGHYVENNQQLAQVLGLEPVPPQYQQEYVVSDVRVKVI